MFRQEIWKLSQDFGAKCEYELSDATSHLISNRIDTEKALESQERGVPAVRPEWIYDCARKWERIDILSYKLEISGKRRRTMTQKRSASDFEDLNELDDQSGDLGPILDQTELEEIQRELEDLEDGSSDSEGDVDGTSNGISDSDNSTDSTDHKSDYSEAELSEEDFSDLLNDSSEND